jgi:hypothetical protein
VEYGCAVDLEYAHVVDLKFGQPGDPEFDLLGDLEYGLLGDLEYGHLGDLEFDLEFDYLGDEDVWKRKTLRMALETALGLRCYPYQVGQVETWYEEM